MVFLESYDILVVGAGHAGIEAAVCAARLGLRTAVFTISVDAIGNLPCNPSIGGTAKGHLVREIDALGGCMGLAADATFLQSRMLNTTKGPAVHSLRVQTDRSRYHLYAKKLLENTANLHIRQAEVTDILLENGRIIGARTRQGSCFGAKAIIMATGTALAGRIHIGSANYPSGPDGTGAATLLSQSLARAGLPLRRFKTGTPARVHKRSIDFSRLQVQPGDDAIIPFSFMTQNAEKNTVNCYIAYTNEKTHRVIRENIHRSPLYSGQIAGVGPRYCPSIEDKVVRFADKNRHPIFVEPCGEDTGEYYLQGMSSSLPEDVQIAMYRTIEGFEKLEIIRPAYAIEYDCIDPLALCPTLETRAVAGLYGAGQFNGSSGYEEAAAQGMVAGINAARAVKGMPAVIFERQQSYIGTLVDDLVTKGASDPYRMMTSRSEYRLYLRQDNADTRLTPLGREIGLVDDARWAVFSAREILGDSGQNPPGETTSAYELLKRPQVSYLALLQAAGRGERPSAAMAQRIETEVKYEGYIKRQLQQIETVRKQEHKLIPQALDYTAMEGLRLEAREKLAAVRPRSLGQAARIPGVSPSDIAQLAIVLARLRREKPKMEAENKPDG